LAVLGVLLSSCAQTSLPDDVLRFVDRRDTCDHFRGEPIDPPDPERLREVLTMLSEYCTGTDVQLAELRARYHANSAVLTRLSEYETVIEQKQK